MLVLFVALIGVIAFVATCLAVGSPARFASVVAPPADAGGTAAPAAGTTPDADAVQALENAARPGGRSPGPATTRHPVSLGSRHTISLGVRVAPVPSRRAGSAYSSARRT